MLQEIITHKRAFRSLLALPGGAEGATLALWQQAGLPGDSNIDSLIDTHFAYDAQTRINLTRTSRREPPTTTSSASISLRRRSPARARSSRS